MAVITMVGAGVMGTALTFPAADNGHEIRLVGTHLDDDIIQSIKESRFHPKLRRHIPDNITPFYHGEIAQAMRGNHRRRRQLQRRSLGGGNDWPAPRTRPDNYHGHKRAGKFRRRPA
jgi:3-hydroxyacyl-CoA dehydrogenase